MDLIQTILPQLTLSSEQSKCLETILSSPIQRIQFIGKLANDYIDATDAITELMNDLIESIVTTYHATCEYTPTQPASDDLLELVNHIFKANEFQLNTRLSKAWESNITDITFGIPKGYIPSERLGATLDKEIQERAASEIETFHRSQTMQIIPRR